jgi:predicted transcriptional regulator
MTLAQRQRFDHVICLVHEDWPASAIAREVGADEMTVRRILHRANYTPAMAAAARKRRKAAHAAALALRRP